MVLLASGYRLLADLIHIRTCGAQKSPSEPSPWHRRYWAVWKGLRTRAWKSRYNACLGRYCTFIFYIRNLGHYVTWYSSWVIWILLSGITRGQTAHPFDDVVDNGGHGNIVQRWVGIILCDLFCFLISKCSFFGIFWGSVDVQRPRKWLVRGWVKFLPALP